MSLRIIGSTWPPATGFSSRMASEDYFLFLKVKVELAGISVKKEAF
jgi:hypothetical protein